MPDIFPIPQKVRLWLIWWEKRNGSVESAAEWFRPVAKTSVATNAEENFGEWDDRMFTIFVIIADTRWRFGAMAVKPILRRFGRRSTQREDHISGR
jgi:hypothetical protein